MIQPASLEELASLVEKRWQEGLSFCGGLVWRLSLHLSCLARN